MRPYGNTEPCNQSRSRLRKKPANIPNVLKNYEIVKGKSD